MIGAYVTIGTHLKLYFYLDALKVRAVCCDMESDIRAGTPTPPSVTCGYSVGDLTDKLGPDEYIEEFMSGGPMKYAYRAMNPAILDRGTVCKVGAITLIYAAVLLINFASTRGVILVVAVDEVMVRSERNMRRNTRRGEGTGLLGPDAVDFVS